MAHRPYPSIERARRQIDRRWGPVEPWAAARPQPPRPVDGAATDPLWVSEYRMSTRAGR
jgi:hypothetical protein